MMAKKTEKAVEDAAWGQLIDAYLCDNSHNVDERWGTALEALQQFEDPYGVLALLTAGAPVPDWAREEIAQWRAGNRPPSTGDVWEEDQKLLVAKRAYDEAPWLTGEKQDDKKERIAHEQASKLGIEKVSILHFLKTEGRPYHRYLARKRWDRNYLDPEHFDYSKQK
jgi:hypothetical protein